MTEAIFANQDVASVPNQVQVSEDWHKCVCAAVEVRFNDDGDQIVNFQWRIDDHENEFHGWPIFEGFYGVDFSTPYQQQDTKAKMTMSRLVNRLRTAFDLSEEELSGLTDWDELVGAEAYLKVKHGRSKDPEDTRVFVNVNDAMSIRLYNEKYGAASSSLGI